MKYISLVNSLTNEKFIVDILTFNYYCCGITVQGDMHIGHARTYLFVDCLRRLFKYAGYNVQFCTNLTDLDHKITNKVVDICNHKYNNTDNFIEEYYHFINYQKKIFHECIQNLHLIPFDHLISVTDVMNDIIYEIEQLIYHEKAYIVNSDIFFNCKKYNIDMEDFLLWSKGKDTDITYESNILPRGKPAWHISCSVINSKIFGDNVYLHSGGKDLIYPHHICECIQSNSIWNKNNVFVHFLHIGVINMNGIKMTKSLNNYISIHTLLKKYDINNLKIMIFMDNYHKDIEYFTLIEHYDFSNTFIQKLKICLTYEILPQENIHIEHLFVTSFDFLYNNLDTHHFILHIHTTFDAIIQNQHINHTIQKYISDTIYILGLII